nr:AT-rich interactive domain-containing protein 5B isoform X2 [Helicoverpa armigera]
MDKPSFKLVGAPCGQHGQYTFYKALRLTGPSEKIIAIGDFFFVKVWQDSELVSIGELQLLWTDRVSDQTLVSLRLYFLPENTPEGRNQHGEDEVLAINEKVVVRADDLLSWMCVGTEWRWGLRAVWRGACAPPTDMPRHAPLTHTKLDFSDVDNEKSAIVVDAEAPGVVVFSYPRYCRYRALIARLEGIQASWLRDSLVAALGGYAAPTNNTRILYCKDTFEYPELEGHEFVCNHLAPRLKGRPRGRRRRALTPDAPPDRSDRASDRASDRSDSDDAPANASDPPTPRRLSLRNGAAAVSDDDELDAKEVEQTPEDRAFLHRLKMFYKSRSEPFHAGHTLKHLSLRALYGWVVSRGGYAAVCARQLWRRLAPRPPHRTRAHYERYLLPFENYERRNGTTFKLNGKTDSPPTIATIDVTDSPLRDDDVKILRTPSPPHKADIDSETGEITTKDDIIVKNAEELNREFLESLPKEEKTVKISVKPVEKLIEPAKFEEKFERKEEGTDMSQSYLDAQKFGIAGESASSRAAPLNGHAAPAHADLKSRPLGRSSLRAVRVKPARPHAAAATTPHPLRPDSEHSPPAGAGPVPPVGSQPAPAPTAGGQGAPVTNFGIHHPPTSAAVDDDIVEVPYKPKTPEIIDLDEYPESPQAVKKKKLDILKERGLEVTALPPWGQGVSPHMIPPPMIINPAMQHQIMTQAQLFQMYNIIPQNYNNGIQPPKVIQASSIFGTSGPEKTVYGNPKDPFMPPPHVLHGVPVKPLRAAPPTQTTPQDILDLTCKSTSPPPQKPAVEIVRVPPAPSPNQTAQNLTKNYTLVDGKAVVGSNLEITLVNKAASPGKNRPPQKRSSNGKFMSAKTPTPPKEAYPKYTTPTTAKKPPINIPNYQIRDESPNQNVQNAMKNQNLAQIMDLQKNSVPMGSFMDPYMALYSSIAGQMDQRQLAMYRDLMTNQFRYPGLLNLGVATPTTKN